MEDFVSESDSDYTSYWRDWVRTFLPKRAVFSKLPIPIPPSTFAVRGASSSAKAGPADACPFPTGASPLEISYPSSRRHMLDNGYYGFRYAPDPGTAAAARSSLRR